MVINLGNILKLTPVTISATERELGCGNPAGELD